MPLSTWLHVPLFLLMVVALAKSARGEKEKTVIFWSALALKLAAGLFYGWVYLTYLGKGDTWRYHSETMALTAWAKADGAGYLRFLFLDDLGAISIPWKYFSNSFFFLKITSLLYLLTGNSYWWTALYLSLFSFWGSWFLVVRLRRYFPEYGTAAVLAFLFFPSVVFWTSGLSKDSVFMGSLCLTVGFFLQISEGKERKSIWQIAGLLLSIWLLWRVKFFLAAVLIVLLIVFLIMQFLVNRLPILRTKTRQLLAWFLLLGGGAFVASFAHPTFTIRFFLEHLVWNFQNILAVSEVNKPLLVTFNLQPTLGSVLINAPSALLQMVYRPFIWEPAPFFYKLAAAENLAFLGLTVLALMHLYRQKRFPKLPGFLTVLLIFFMVAGVLVTLPTPNLGSLVRYRAPLLPFFLTVLLTWGPLPGRLRRRN